GRRVHARSATIRATARARGGALRLVADLTRRAWGVAGATARWIGAHVDTAVAARCKRRIARNAAFPTVARCGTVCGHRAGLPACCTVFGIALQLGAGRAARREFSHTGKAALRVDAHGAAVGRRGALGAAAPT